MQLELVTLTGLKLAEEVYEVTAPTKSGEISIFPGHESLVTLATDGVLYVRRKRGDSNDARDVFALSGGVIQISPKLVRVLVDEADSADELVAQEIEAALERAKDQRKNAKDVVSISEAEALMNRAATRLKVANLRRRR